MFRNKKIIINLHKKLFKLVGDLINITERELDFTAEEFGHKDIEFTEPDQAIYDKTRFNDLVAICCDLLFKAQVLIRDFDALKNLSDTEFDNTTFLLKVANDILEFKLFKTRKLINYFCKSSVRFGHLVETVETLYDALLN